MSKDSSWLSPPASHSTMHDLCGLPPAAAPAASGWVNPDIEVAVAAAADSFIKSRRGSTSRRAGSGLLNRFIAATFRKGLGLAHQGELARIQQRPDDILVGARAAA